MQTIHAVEKTDSDGTLTLRVPLGRPDTEFEVVVIVQPKATATGAPATPPIPDRWAAINAFRDRLAASGRVFTDSTELIREDRER
jgi:hypothetical protein